MNLANFGIFYPFPWPKKMNCPLFFNVCTFVPSIRTTATSSFNLFAFVSLYFISSIALLIYTLMHPFDSFFSFPSFLFFYIIFLSLFVCKISLKTFERMELLDTLQCETCAGNVSIQVVASVLCIA